MKKLVLIGAWTAAMACVVRDERHCANRAGDETCRARLDDRRWCSACTAAHDGCVAAPVSDPACADEVSSSSSSGSSSSSATTLAATATDAESTGAATTIVGTDGSDSAADATDAGIETTSTETTSTETTSTTGGGATCGNGIVEGDEACDGEDLGGQTCAALPEFADGELACDARCRLATGGCAPCRPSTLACADDSECCSESCSGLGLCL